MIVELLVSFALLIVEFFKSFSLVIMFVVACIPVVSLLLALFLIDDSDYNKTRGNLWEMVRIITGAHPTFKLDESWNIVPIAKT